jgi:hypothetical protein
MALGCELWLGTKSPYSSFWHSRTAVVLWKLFFARHKLAIQGVTKSLDDSERLYIGNPWEYKNGTGAIWKIIRRRYWRNFEKVQYLKYYLTNDQSAKKRTFDILAHLQSFDLRKIVYNVYYRSPLSLAIAFLLVLSALSYHTSLSLSIFLSPTIKQNLVKAISTMPTLEQTY